MSVVSVGTWGVVFCATAGSASNATLSSAAAATRARPVWVFGDLIGLPPGNFLGFALDAVADDGAAAEFPSPKSRNPCDSPAVAISERAQCQVQRARGACSVQQLSLR